jgi:uncharacterized protein
MRLSRYTSLVRDYPEAGQHLTFNWLTQSMAVLDDELRQLVEAPGPFDATLLPPELAQQLERMGILVEDEVDERQEIEHWHREVRNNRRTFKAMVMTTYDCNFACTYCVEEGVKRPVKLVDTLAERTVRWIIARLEEQGSEKLYLNFYGGEPLLNVAGLEQVAGPLLAYTRAQGLEFEGSVTTNGALLHRKNAERLARAGITLAKVTIDGDQEAHDQKRPFKGGHGSFELIMRNLEEIWDLIEVRLGGNVDCQNLHAVPRLMDYLEERGLAEKIGGIQFSGISSQARDGFRHLHQELLQIESPEPLLQIEAVAPALPTQSSLRGDLFALNHQAARRGLPVRKAITASLCLLNQEENAVVIDPLGKIYKCPALVGHEAFIVGDLSQGRIHYDHLRLDGEDLEGCLDCKWFAVCGGGCRFMSFLKTGDVRHKDCNQEFFDQYGDEMIVMDYEILLRERGETV